MLIIHSSPKPNIKDRFRLQREMKDLKKKLIKCRPLVAFNPKINNYQRNSWSVWMPQKFVAREKSKCSLGCKIFPQRFVYRFPSYSRFSWWKKKGKRKKKWKIQVSLTQKVHLAFQNRFRMATEEHQLQRKLFINFYTRTFDPVV